MTQLYLNKLQVTNFRNLEGQVVELSNGINCIFGNNGNGKTNLLEAIYYLSQRKSFRKNTSFPQMINVECENPEIIFLSLLKDLEDNSTTFSGKLSPSGQEWFLNNKPTKKKLDFQTIFINPFDSFLFHSTASFRRNWIDQHISMMSKEYKTTLSKYTQSLRFRNNLLSKKPANYLEQLKAIDLQFAEYAYKLIELRKQFLSELKDYCKITFKLIFNEVHDLEIHLDSKLENYSQDQIYNYYQENIQKDAIIGHTRVGVHKDDYLFQFDGYNSYEYCSLGQQKMSFLSLLFAYIELFRYKFTSYPMVLIDDVSGELDSLRWKNLIEYLEAKKFQVLITTANEGFKKELKKISGVKNIHIDNGSMNVL